ncbi:MAG: protein kinase [Labilithrix sp.]|nr:protein kinase [Labilithrix sp.]
MARPSPPSIPPGTVLGGRYVLGAKLGAGGMGAVFEATNEQGQLVAVKTLLVGPGAPAAAAETRARFDREIDTCARLRHKNLLTLLDHGVDEATGAPYLVMPRMRGEDLAQLLARVKVLEPSVAVPLVLQACRGVAAGHAAASSIATSSPRTSFWKKKTGSSW